MKEKCVKIKLISKIKDSPRGQKSLVVGDIFSNGADAHRFKTGTDKATRALTQKIITPSNV